MTKSKARATAVLRRGVGGLRREQIVEVALEALAGLEDLAGKPALPFFGQAVASDELACDADGGQLGPNVMFDLGSSFSHARSP